MSFILDALRKAERERQWARVPTLETVHAAPAAPPRRRWPWLVGALGVAGTAAGLVLGRPWTAPRPAPSPPSPPVATAPRAAPVSSPALAATPPPPATAPEPTPRPAPAPVPAAVAAVPTPPTPRPLPGARVPEPPRAPAGEPAPRAATPLPAATPATAVSPAAVPEPPARAAAEPATPLTLNALVYSEDPSERLVFINGRKYVEGQTVDGGAVVESITREGVVLGLHGRRIVLR